MTAIILLAPQSFINYVEGSAHFLNCPNQRFNEDLNSTYRQFKGRGDNPGVIMHHLAILLFTFGYSKTDAKLYAFKLYNYYEETSMADFNKANVSSYKDGIPKRLIDKNHKINMLINSRKTYYPNGMVNHQGYYAFKKGYKLKSF